MTIVPPPLAVVPSAAGWFNVGTSATTFCWFSGPVPSAPTLMLNTRFCQMTLLNSSGYDTVRQLPLVAVPAKWPAGQVMVAGRFAVMFELFCMATMPAG